MRSTTKLAVSIGAAALLACGLLVAKPPFNPGDMGVFYGPDGGVVGTFVVNCDGEVNIGGTQTNKWETNGDLWCNFPS